MPRPGRRPRQESGLAFPNVLDETDPTETKPKPFLPGDANLTERAQFWSYVVPLTTVPGTSPGDPPGTTLNQGFDNFWPDGRGKKSRTQWQDHTRSAHATKAGASCMTCHAFHGEAMSKDPQQQAKLRQPVKELCESCHNRTGATWQPNKEMFAGTAAVAPSQHALAEVQCVDCHMGAVGQRMTKTTKKNEPAFDVSFHGTSMTLASHDTMVPVGSPDMRGNCEVCHTDERPMANGTIPPPKTTLELIEYVRKIQDYTKSQIREVQTRSKSNKSVNSATVLQLSNAQANLNMILIDGSLGVHNSRITPAGVVSLQGAGAICLRNARNWIELACRQPGANCQPFSEPINGPLPAPSPPLCLQ